MKKLHIVMAGIAALSVAATVGAAQTGGVGKSIDAIQSVLGVHGGPGEVVRDGGRQVRASGSAEDFRWSGRVAAGDEVEIKGINGDVTIERSSGRDVVVTAEARGRRSDPSTVRIEMVEHRDGLTFCAVYPTPEGKRENYCGAGHEGRMSTERNDVSVHFRVEVPEGVSVIGRTVNGDVEAFDLGSDIHAVTVNGDIEISTTGAASAETVNGSIEAEMGAREIEGDLSFSTVNGSITLDLDDGVDADLDASWLNGSFESDLAFTVQGRMSRRSARGFIGDGGPEVTLKTVNGSIHIR